jgi:hypothetical protein
MLNVEKRSRERSKRDFSEAGFEQGEDEIDSEENLERAGNG